MYPGRTAAFPRVIFSPGLHAAGAHPACYMASQGLLCRRCSNTEPLFLHIKTVGWKGDSGPFDGHILPTSSNPMTTWPASLTWIFAQTMEFVGKKKGWCTSWVLIPQSAHGNNFTKVPISQISLPGLEDISAENSLSRAMKDLLNPMLTKFAI